MKNEPEKILVEIKQAFAQVERGNGITLHEADVIDDYGLDEERLAARKKDTDEKWEDVPGEAMDNALSPLAFLDPQGLRYYLPAYMTWSLKNNAEGCDATSAIISILGTLGSRSSWKEHYALLTKEQKIAISHFLAFTADHSASELDRQNALLTLMQGPWGKLL